MTDESKDGLQWRASLMIERFDEDAVAYARKQMGLGRDDWSRSVNGRLVNEPTAADFEMLGIRPYDVSQVESNLLTTAGLTRITSLILGAGGQAATNTSARLGLGNGAGTAAVGDTDMSAAAGSANRWYNIMDATFPSSAAGVMTFKSTFASADGNFAWNEWGVDIGTPTVTSSATVAAVLLNHKTGIAQGTKASGQSWAATATITLS